MKKNLILIICFFILIISSYAESVRLKDISRVYGARSNQLMGMGLVVGLNGDGDKSALTPQMLQNLFKYFDDNDYYYFKSIEDTYAIKNDILKLLDTYQI